MLLLVTACNSGDDNSDGSQDNFKFSKDQLGFIQFSQPSVDFGKVVLDELKIKYIEIKNTGKLPLIFGETLFDGKKSAQSFYYSGDSRQFPGEGGTCPEQLEAGEQCVISLSFLPLATKTEVVEYELFYENGLGEDSSKLTLNGYGGDKAAVSFSTSSLDFTLSDQGNYQERTFTLSNDGGQVARNLTVSLTQTPDAMARELFAILPSSTCSQTAFDLGIGETCDFTISSTVNSDQEYQTFIATFGIDYEYDPNKALVDSDSLDIIQQVVSIEGELTIPVTSLDFGTIVNGHITEKNFLIQNTGYKELSVETVSISGDGGSASVDITECTERSDEVINGSGKLVLAPNESCIFALRFSPTFGSLPFDFSSTDIYFTYDDGKFGIENSEHIDFTSVLVNPADIEIIGSADPHLESWAIGSVFVANDNRFNLESIYTITNTGDVIADNVTIGISGSPYFSLTHDCPIKLAKGQECDIEIDFTPLKSIYDSTPLLDITADLEISYEAGDSISLGVPLVSQSFIQTTGSIDNLPQLVFNNFDTSSSGSTVGVTGSSAFYDIEVKNVGATDELDFDLALSNSTEFFIVDDIGLTTIGGNPNCAHIDEAAGSLASGAVCAYRIRSFSAVAGDFASDLTVNFQAGGAVSAIHTYNASFVGPGKLSLENPIPETKVAINSYASFNYPGTGSSTNINDVSVQRYYSTTDRAVDPSKMTFPAIAGSETFDFAYMEVGYIPYGSDQVTNVDFKNIGEFEIELRSISLTEVYNMVSLTDVTASGYVTLNDSSCTPSGSAVVVDADGVCTNQLTMNLPDGSMYRTRIEMTYTLGHKTTPSSEDLVTYTSSMYFYAQGYNQAGFAKIEPFAPAGFAADKSIELSEVFGGDNTDNEVGTLRNTSTVTATDIHYIVTENNESTSILSGTTTIAGMSAAGAPITNYYRLNISECTGAVADEMAMSEECNIDISYAPIEEEEKELFVYYRYHNGLTYEENEFKITIAGLTPAELVIKNLSEAAGDYIKDFGDQIVEGVHEEFVEIKNEGQAVANNLELSILADPFRIEPSDHPDLAACDATVDPDETCYIKLVYNPGYPELQVNSEESVEFTWENGVFNLAVPDLVTTTIVSKGYAEEKHSQHQGWTSIQLAGYNQPYADYLEVNDIQRPTGGYFGPEELGLVELKWNKMADEGIIPNAITEYAIFKNTTGLFDIKNDSPYATVPHVALQDEYTFLDDALENEPGKVYFYYVAPLRSGNVSRVNTEDYPQAILRAVIPHSFKIGMHKHMAAMAACKKMDIDILDPLNIDLATNGCKYTDSFSNAKVFKVDYDTHMDMFEAGNSYSLSSGVTINQAGDTAKADTLENARSVCQEKRVLFDSTEPSLSGFYYMDLPNRREHFYFSEKSAGYTQADCEIVDNEIVLGDQVDCRSDMGLENMAGGLPEWTIAQVDGFGKGKPTEVNLSVSDKSINNIDFRLLFSPSFTGENNFVISDMSDPIQQRCFNTITGLFSPKVAGDCNGDHLLNLTNDVDDASPTTLFLQSTEPANTAFSLFVLNDDISDSTLRFYGVAGGGDMLSSTATNHDYSAYTTKFIFNFTDSIGYRCSTRVGY